MTIRQWFVVTTVVALFLGLLLHEPRQHALMAHYARMGIGFRGKTFVRVSSETLTLDDSQLPDVMKEVIRQFRPTSVHLSGSRFNDDLFEWLQPIEGKLACLSLDDTCVTDQGMTRLAHYRALHHLSLKNVKVSDAGIRLVARIEGMKGIDLQGTLVGDVAVAELARNCRLRQLNLSGTAVTDGALRALETQDGLEELLLDDTTISDDGLSHLRNNPSLREISLNGTRITDKGLDALATMSTLRWVKLRGTQVTEAGVHALAEALPKAIIIGDGGSSSGYRPSSSVRSEGL